MTHPTLKELAIRYVTDKEITYGHNYTPGYTALFECQRYRIRNLLEIGIGLGPHYDLMVQHYPSYTIGGGLKMWRDYFPYAQIFGMDLYECPIDEPRITTVVGNQSSREDLLRIVDMIGGSIDIVIDDGSHQAVHQVFSFMVLAPFMVVGGIYVIEDVQSAHIEAFKTLTIFPTEFQAYIRRHFEIRWYDTRVETDASDDFLMVFIRK